MGRNLILGNGPHSESFSRAFTEVVWDNSLGIFEPSPQSRSVGDEQIIAETTLREWFDRVLAAAQSGPILYEIWRLRLDGDQESDAAYAWHQGRAVMIESQGRHLEIKPIDKFPDLDYEPPQWTDLENFYETYASTPLTLQAEPPAEFFSYDFDQLKRLLEHRGDFWVSML